ncbi:MAG: adenine phosphoribosyltransferase [Spirochaetales bacterium]|jgi:adenine phosphoribosyltransferase|nr:adenine phosphoribosyltransferase [Spirochaetales bacterium]
MTSCNSDLDAAIRRVPDFPRPGILFYDVTGILMNPRVFRYCVERLAVRAKEAGAGAIAAIEARGFIFAAPVAERCGLPLVLVRKKGKLPGETVSRGFALEYGEDSIEVQKADLATPAHILIIDDLIATGGTLSAAAAIFRESGFSIAGIAAVIGLPFLNFRDALPGIPIHTLIDYHGEET